jgi:hypothetical protein
VVSAGRDASHWRAEVLITDSSNTQLNVDFKTTVTGSISARVTHVFTPSAGAATYKARARTSAGTLDTNLSATQYAFMAVYDDGPNGNPA